MLPSSPIVRAALIFAVALALLAGGMALWRFNSPTQPAAVSGVARTSGTALIGGDFELVDQTGTTRRPADFAGRFMLVFFGFTYCPDVCPTTLSIVTQALDILEQQDAAAAAKVVPLFITVDPERDTVAVMKDYAAHFHPAMVALTGSAEQVAQAAKAYRVYYAKVEDGSAEDYLVDHSSFLFLMGPDGDYVAHFTHDATAEEIADALRNYAGG
ncbi:MAG: SCO family protein [Kiloniellales bacterium]